MVNRTRATTVSTVPVCLAILALLVALPGCGLGDRQRNAEVIHRSRARVADADTAVGTLHLELEVDESAMDRLEAAQRERLAEALAGSAGRPELTVQTGLDARTRRARVSFGDATGPGSVFADTAVFVRRQNARPTERRTWATLDLADLPDKERPLDASDMTPGAILTAVASTVNPVYLLELAEGALAGSVKRGGTDAVAGAEVTRYDANISLDKAITQLDFDDDERKIRLRLFHLLGARKDVLPASFWIDGEGRLRRMQVEFEQRVTRQRKNSLTATLELTAFVGEDLDAPAPEETVEYEAFGRLVRSALPEGA